MCNSPAKVYRVGAAGLEVLQARCRTCEVCRYNRVDDFVARALCEGFVSDWTAAVTLTYRDSGKGYEHAVHVNHGQKFIRSLRRRGHNVRYMMVAERGETKGRVHFHAILFGKGKRPDVPHRRRVHVPSWRHGHTFWDFGLDRRKVRYVVKYLNKPDLEWFSLSKKPVLGHAFIDRLAAKYAEGDLVPRSLVYRPPGATAKDRFALTGVAEREFLRCLFQRAPHLRERKGTPWYENAKRRLTNWEQQRCWLMLPQAERDEIILDAMGNLADRIRDERREAALRTEMGRLWSQKVENRYGAERQQAVAERTAGRLRGQPGECSAFDAAVEAAKAQLRAAWDAAVAAYTAGDIERTRASCAGSGRRRTFRPGDPDGGGGAEQVGQPPPQ